jgi:hypothetical protein
MAIWLKKLIYILTLNPGFMLLGASTHIATAEPASSHEIQQLRTENEIGALEDRFAQQKDFDCSKINEVIKMRLAECTSLVPLKKNIDAMLILWDAGNRNPDVFIATLLHDTAVDQTVIVHLYGPKVSELLNELSTNDPANMSDSAKLIASAFEATETSKAPNQ